MKNKHLKSARISEAKFRALLRLFAADIPATKTTQLLHLNYLTTHRIYTLLRKRIVHLTHQESAPFFGEVEVDESYFGARRIREKRGRGAAGKIPILGKGLVQHRREIAEKFGLSHNVMRHTFISMMVAATNSKDFTAMQAGNSVRIINKHYYAVKMPTEAEAFFHIAPQQRGDEPGVAAALKALKALKSVVTMKPIPNVNDASGNTVSDSREAGGGAVEAVAAEPEALVAEALPQAA